LLQIVGEEESPGVKRGGFVNIVKRVIHVVCSSTSIPAFFEVDVSKMDMGARVKIADLGLPDNVEVVGPPFDGPVVKIAGRSRS
jgi:large subunit ribosomal protein L25